MMEILTAILASRLPVSSVWQQRITAGMRFAVAHPNPYGLRIPARRYMKFRTPPLIGKFIKKEPTKATTLLETIWDEGSFESRQIAGKSLEKFGPKNPKICLDFIL